MKKIISLLIAVTLLSACGKDSVLLRLKYKEGSSYITKMEVVQEMPSMKNNMTMEMKTKIISLKEGVIQTENSFDRIIVDVDSQGKKIKYSSDMKEADMSPAEKMMHEQMKGLKDAVVLMSFNERGVMNDVKLTAGDQMHLESFKESSPVEFPEEAVKVGSIWKKTKSKQGMEINSVYTVKSISSDEVVLDVKGTVSGVAKGDVSGTMTIETATGHTIKSDVNTTISMAAMEMKVKLNLTSSKI